MRKIIIAASLLALVAAPARAQQTVSTVNPAVPAQYSSLSSATLRAQFQAAYNDITALFAKVNALAANVSIQSLSGVVVAGSSGVTAFGPFPSATLSSAITDETGTGSAVFASSPTITSPQIAGALRLPGYTVSTLPAGTVGSVAYVTDATACTYGGALTGGGAVKCKVWFNGSAWVGG